jgi:hypothetical protein
MPSPWTCRAVTSRKLSPSFASISDFARVIPMLVPSPPLSLSTTASSSGAPPSSSDSRSTTPSAGSISDSGSMPRSPAASCS